MSSNIISPERLSKNVLMDQLPGTLQYAPENPQEELRDADKQNTALELILKTAWADVLELDDEEIWPESHFFELGGNSLCAAELVALTAENGVRLTRQMVFKEPVFANLVNLALSRSRNDHGQLNGDTARAPPQFSLISQDDIVAALEQCDTTPAKNATSNIFEDIFPATALQTGLMVKSISQPGVYITSRAFYLRNTTDPEMLRDALYQAGRKLPILRTTMTVSEEHGFVQVILNNPPPVRVIRAASSRELSKWLDSSQRPAMSPGKPLMRMDVVVDWNQGNGLWLVWHAHHAVYDTTTLMLIARHIEDIASGLQMLPEPPSFANFVSYSLRVRNSPEWRVFWSDHLRGAPTPFFPRRMPSPEPNGSLSSRITKTTKTSSSTSSSSAVPETGTRNRAGALELVYCTDALYTTTLDWACAPDTAGSGFTHANIFIAAWAYLLSCYENSDDVVFGVTNGGRYSPVPGCADMVAPTIATIPLRVKMVTASSSETPARPTITEYLQRVSMLAVEASAWEQVGLSLIRDLGPDERRACTFPTRINIQTTSVISGAETDSQQSFLIEPTDPEHVEPLDFALVLELSPWQGNGLPLRLSYDSRVLQRCQVTQIATHLQQVLDAFSTSSVDATLDSLNEATDTPGTSTTRLRRYAAVACGVADAALHSVVPCTNAQEEAIISSIETPSANLVRRVFTVPCNCVSKERLMEAWTILMAELPILRSRFITTVATSPASFPAFLQVIVDGQVLWQESSDLKHYLAADLAEGLTLGRPATRLGLISGDEESHSNSGDEHCYFMVLTMHRAVVDLTDGQVDTVINMLQKAIESTSLPGSVAGNGITDSLSSPPCVTPDDDDYHDDDELPNVLLTHEPDDNIASCFPNIPIGHTPLTSISTLREVRLSGYFGALLESKLQAAWILTLSQYCESNDVSFGLALPPQEADSGIPILARGARPIVPQRIVLEALEMPVMEFVGLVRQRTEKLIERSRHHPNHSDTDVGGLSNALFVDVTHDPGFPPATPTSNATVRLANFHDAALAVYRFGLVCAVTAVTSAQGHTTLVKIRIHLDPAIITPNCAQRLVTHYEHVLAQLAAVADADADSSPSAQVRLSQVTHLPDAHLDQILSWNSNVPSPVERLVCGMFEEQADAQPLADAVVARDGKWTFLELDQAAERVARWLRSFGVKPGCFVALVFEKSGLAIIAMLAILKAGGASVALDPSHTPERLHGLVQTLNGDASRSVVILGSNQNRVLATGLLSAGARHTLILDAVVMSQLSAELSSSSSPVLRINQDPTVVDKPIPNDHAFVLFTSGSTGTPKGILIPHRAFASSISGHSKLLRFSTGPGSRNLQFTAYTSDVSIGEIFTSLAVGSCVCVPSEWDRQNNLAGSMRDLKINWAFFTPSVASLLKPDEVPLLRTLVLGGETASKTIVQTWAPSLHLINSFGPAECSIWTNCIPRPVVPSDFGSNIGHSVGCATWIVDPDNYHCLRPIGAVGEMLVEGPNVAEGYLNEPIKTGQAFVYDPAWMPTDRRQNQQPMRLYRTGDMARYLDNGMIQFLGRRDHQIKLNGLRVELGEIENQASWHVGDDLLVAVDVVRPQGADISSPKTLACFIAPKVPLRECTREQLKADIACLLLPPPGEHGIENGTILEKMRGLEDHLRRVLPSHMVPAVYVPLLTMPLTASAKTDRAILKEVASILSLEKLIQLSKAACTDFKLSDKEVADTSCQRPATDMERLMAQLWAKTLRLDTKNLSAHDNFFKVGGDSLSAMRLVSLARRKGIALSVAQALSKPLLRDMAEAVSLLMENVDCDDSENNLQDAHHQQHHQNLQNNTQRNDDRLQLLDAKSQTPFALVGDYADLRRHAIHTASAQLGIEEALIEDIYPCTPLQQGLLALSQSGVSRYVAQMVYELPVSVDLRRFEEAWDIVLRRWSILRTRFFEWTSPADGASKLMQAVIGLHKVRWLRARSLADYLEIDRRDQMQLGDRMLRLALFKDAEGNRSENHLQRSTFFVMTIHHALYDGWMLGLLLEAVRNAYTGVDQPSIIPFQSFMAHLGRRPAEESRMFWQQYVGDAEPLTWPALPRLDYHPRSTSECQRTVALSPSVLVSNPGSEKAGGDGGGYTPTTWIRAALAVLLGSYCDSDDVLFASSVYGRAVILDQGTAETVAGPTLATVPVRVRAPRGMLMHEVLESVQQDAASMLAHEQEGMQNIRPLNRAALASLDAQVLLVVQVDDGSSSLERDDHELMLKRPSATNEFALANGFLGSALVIEATVSTDHALRLRATYDEQVIPHASAERFLRQLSHIAFQLCRVGKDSLADNADLCVADLDLIPPEDIDETNAWNANVPVPADALVHSLFEELAAQQPNEVALVSWEGSFTYRRLNEISDRLAALLYAHHGLGPSKHISLVFEKSIWAVVAMLAVLKIGAAFAALDPERDPVTLRDLGTTIDAAFVLCSEKHQQLASTLGLPTKCVGPSACSIEEHDDHHTTDRIHNGAAGTFTPAQTAFFLFTSGSTGNPKAIVIDHNAFSSSIRGHGETLCYQQGSRNLQFTAYTSDVSMGEIFTSLSRGATVCVPSDDERMNDLAGAMERMQVDWAFLTPSVASLLDPNSVPSLRTLVFGGETATAVNVKTWAPRLHLVNSFGPAETSVWCHAHPRFPGDGNGSDIGWSLGCGTWILDPDDFTRRMPVGAVGELVIEGPNVAVEYYKNISKTETAFLKGAALPWLQGERRDNRVYRTGDLARWMYDGRVQFLGRRDTQVKLRGFKVDVNEVENAIRASLTDVDNMAEVAVEVIRNARQSQDARLVAFVSCAPASAPTSTEGQTQADRRDACICEDEQMLAAFAKRTLGLRTKLAARLAALMMPSFVIPLTAMPLSASAKTDRKRLRSLLGNLSDDVSFVRLSRFALAPQQEAVREPTTREEKFLHGLWCSVLDLDARGFGVEANFFERGGDSIAAMKMASLTRAAGFPLSVQQLYTYPRLEHMATQIQFIHGDTGTLPAEPDAVITPFSLLPELLSDQKGLVVAKAVEACGAATDDAIADVYPCTPVQRSMIQTTNSRPGAWWLHNVFDLPSRIHLPRLKQALHRTVEIFDILRTRIFVLQDTYLQAVLRYSAVETGQLAEIYDKNLSLEAFVQADMTRIRGIQNVEGQPLVRLTLVNDRHLILTLHHATYDAWSITNMMKLLEKLYLEPTVDLDSQSGIPAQLQLQGAAFKSFVGAILAQDQAEATRFWTTSLLGVNTRPFLSSYDGWEGNPSNRLLRHRIKIDDLSAAASPMKPDSVTTAEMIYAALALALHCHLQMPDVVLRVVSTGRSMPGVTHITELVGPTVTAILLRVQHGDADAVPDYLSRVTAQLRHATTLEHFGYDATCELLREQGEGGVDAERACRQAPQVVVHPQDPYTEQPAPQMGLDRRQLSPFTDDGAPFTIDVSLVTQNKRLRELDVRVLFADNAADETHLRLLVARLDVIVRRIMAADPNRWKIASLLDMESDQDAVCERAKGIGMTRKEDFMM